MDKAIGLVEYKTVPSGILGADAMVKTAAVDILEAQTVCPGKYIVLVCGDLSAVTAAIETGKGKQEDKVIDSFILGNPHESIFSAITGTSQIETVEALGIIESYSISSIVVAADIAAKTAKVNLVEIRIARGMSGKSYVIMTGEISAVTASVEAGSKKLEEEGMLLDKVVIANPDKRVWENIL